jgi:putative phosphoesterase
MALKILVVSDSHGAKEKLLTLFYEQDVNAVIFLGDGLRDAQYLSDRSGAVTVYRVVGNCDGYCPDALERQLLKLGGKNIFFTHGHLYGAKLGTAGLLNVGKNIGADVVLFGHTHRQFYEKQDGIILANPGSLFSGKYGILEIQNGQIAFKFGEF